MLNFISLGSGSSGNCYLLYTENDALLIDLGIGTRTLRKYFREYGLPLSRVKHILITHDHADHVKSVGKISHDLELPVYTTRDVHKGIDGNYCVRCKVPSTLVKIIEKDVPVEIGDFLVTPFRVPHDSTDNVGYRIECQGVVFCMMTDVGFLSDEMKPMISDANYLVLEANYDEEMLKAAVDDPQRIRDAGRVLKYLSTDVADLASFKELYNVFAAVLKIPVEEESPHG